jgi:hypothetical protein
MYLVDIPLVYGIESLTEMAVIAAFLFEDLDPKMLG